MEYKILYFLNSSWGAKNGLHAGMEKSLVNSLGYGKNPFMGSTLYQGFFHTQGSNPRPIVKGGEIPSIAPHPWVVVIFL